MFDLVLTMSVGVLLRLGVPLRKIGFVKFCLKKYFLKILKLIRADKKKLSSSRNFCQLGLPFEFL